MGPTPVRAECIYARVPSQLMNFLELRKGEFRRTRLLRASVHEPSQKGEQVVHGHMEKESASFTIRVLSS